MAGALDTGPGGLEISPSSSGRASPVPKRWRLQGADESHSKDKAFRRYASGVERSLSLFDTALQEWADYISFLGRLLKSLQAHPSTLNVVPSKAIVAKRLAQCLNPSLPSGVHQKAIEVYSFIFSMIGKDALSRDLPLYLPGLSSTLSFASLSTRGPFLALLETHVLRVQPQSLRPALKAMILCLLPGLEEETSEDFDRTLKLLNGFKYAIRAPDGEDLDCDNNSGDEYFWQCFFLAAITSSGRRLGALAYLMRNLPKLGQPIPVDAMKNGSQKGEANLNSGQLAEIVTSPEPGLLLRCFAAGLADEQLLIQRGFLDLLVTHLPLHSCVLQERVKSQDLELLITAAAGVVSRREMSLNRRLWTWLLGPEPVGVDTDGGLESPISTAGDALDSHSSRTRYFEEFGLHPLTDTLLKIIAKDAVNPVERAKPFRICLSLMDRWEIGGLVVPDIFLPLVDNVRKYKDVAASKTDFMEVLRSASVFFDGVESGLIWGEVVGLIAQSIGSTKLSSAEKIHKLSLVKFMIAHFNVREEEMLLVHAPLTTLTILTILEDLTEKPTKPSSDRSDSGEVSRLALSIAMDLIDLIPARVFQTRPAISRLTVATANRNETNTELPSSSIIQSIKRFYVQDHGNLDSCQPPFSLPETCGLLLRAVGNIICWSVSGSLSSIDIGIKSKLLVMMLVKMPKVPTFDTSRILLSMHGRLQERPQPPFLIYTSTTSLATTLYSTNYISLADLSNLVEPLVRSAWSYLGASDPKYHVEAVRNLWQLQIALPLSNREIEAAICSLVIERNVDGTFACCDADPGRRFSTLWTHTLQEHSGIVRRSSRTSSAEPDQAGRGAVAGDYQVMLARPLFLMLDALQEERSQLFMTVRTWLQTLVRMDRLFHLFVTKLTSFAFLQNSTHDSVNLRVHADGDDVEQCLYYLATFSTLLRWSSDSMWATLAETSISTDTTHMSLYSISGQDREMSLLRFFVHVCLRVMSGNFDQGRPEFMPGITQLHRTALSILHQILTCPYSLPLADLELENDLIGQLSQSSEGSDPFVQVLLLDVVFDSLRLRNIAKPVSPILLPALDHKRSVTEETAHSTRRSMAIDSGDHYLRPSSLPPPPTLVKCLQAGFTASSSRPVLDSWVSFLIECLPFYTETIFQIMIPLVETFCFQIEKTFSDLQGTFFNSVVRPEGTAAPETTLITLLNGLEHVLERGHDILLRDEARSPVVKTAEQPQGFFGNMVSGVFASETPHARSITANNRLTVLLSFHDAVRICFTIWSWGSDGSNLQDTESTASFNYTSLRMRNRARRLLEHLFLAEALECLEVMVEIWQRSNTVSESSVVFNLLHVLDGSRPKYTIPAIFDAIYSRTNPTALEPARKSTLTSSLADSDLVRFLVDYARSLEDDAMDEIWMDCMTFLKDLLTNPFPHRQTLPNLLEFTAVLGEKVDNTNFGEQRRMRRELGELFLRLLTAIFTTRPLGFLESTNENDDRSHANQARSSDDVVGILASIAPNFPKILIEQDRIVAAANAISANVISPTFKAKTFPENVSKSTLVLLYQISRLPNTQKSWRKDLGDAFNDPRFFASAVSLVESDWLPLLRQWSLTDKERMPEILSRLQSPTTAGIVFGVGATSARLEADRKMQQNLRRVAVLLLSTVNDNFLSNLPAILQKIVELLGATTTSSPSSTTRADIYLLLRALALKFSPVHLATIWPIINAELQSAIASVVAPDHSTAADTFNNHSTLQACKLLDTLICIAPDDFQLHEWLYISDTIDAVYRPSTFQPTSLIDELSEELGSTALDSTAHAESAIAIQAASSQNRRPLIGPAGISDEGSWERKDELVGKVFRPFFSQLSIFAFESTHAMSVPDLEACKSGLLKDLFDERSIVKAL